MIKIMYPPNTNKHHLKNLPTTTTTSSLHYHRSQSHPPPKPFATSTLPIQPPRSVHIRQHHSINNDYNNNKNVKKNSKKMYSGPPKGPPPNHPGFVRNNSYVGPPPPHLHGPHPTPTPPPPPQQHHPHHLQQGPPPPRPYMPHQSQTAPVAHPPYTPPPPQAQHPPNMPTPSPHQLQQPQQPGFQRRASMPDMKQQQQQRTSPSPVSPIGSSDGPKLSISPPTINDLSDLYNRALSTGDGTTRVKFAKSLFRFIERSQSTSPNSSSIRDQRIVRWVEESVNWIKRYRSEMPPIPEALYLHGDLAMSGTFPSLVPRNPQEAFRAFEAAANAEYAPAWYRIGREYEAFQELQRARDAFESGRRIGDVTCTYRLGMAYLLGQLDLRSNPKKAVDYLHTAALISERLAESETAAPMYIYAMMLAGEFDAPNLTTDILAQNHKEAGQWMYKAAYLNHAPAQFKCGHAYEYALLGFPFDPLLSVEYYYLASQQGDAEADMALSKWFLCGAENYFEQDEELAFTFAQKAAAKDLPSAVFALAYYHEVGIARRKDLAAARKWYEKALTLNDQDAKERAKERLDALVAGGNDSSMSRAEHMNHVESKLVRKHTQARMRSDANSNATTNSGQQQSSSSSPSSQQQQQQQQGLGNVGRRNTVRKIQQATLGNNNSNNANGGAAENLPTAQTSTPPLSSSSSASNARPQQHQHQGSAGGLSASQPAPSTNFTPPNSAPPDASRNSFVPSQSPAMLSPGHNTPPPRAPSPGSPYVAPPGSRPSMYGAPPQGVGGFAVPSPPPQQQQQQNTARLTRYTLTDTPLNSNVSTAGSSDSGYASTAPQGAGSGPGPVPGASSNAKPTEEAKKPAKGPATFEEMGVPVSNIKKHDDCIIM